MDIEKTMTREQHHQSIARLAGPAFAHHTLEKETDISWHCRRPGTTFYGFRLLTPPGHVVVLGDLGVQAFKTQLIHSISWLLSVQDDIHYLMGKACHPDWVFLIAESNREIQETKDNKAIAEWDAQRYKNEFTWAELWYRHWNDAEPPKVQTYSSQSLWHYHALRTFCKLYQTYPETRA